MPEYKALLTPRDRELLQAVACSPLTVRQLLKWSSVFQEPFGSERRIQDRLRILTEAGFLRRGRYATSDPSVLNYYTLSLQGLRLLHGEDRVPAGSGLTREVAISRQYHTRALADFLTHTVVSAAPSGLAITDFYRENTLRLESAEMHLFPDAAFSLVLPNETRLRFFVELDTGSESVASKLSLDTWERKLTFYESLQDSCGYRFRVLGIVTRSQLRLDNILAMARSQARNPRRSLFYGICLADYLAEPRALHAAIFRDHRGHSVPLVPGSRVPLPPSITVAPVLTVC